MSEIWLTSDTHFGHSKIIEYTNRPFANVDEMNEALVNNWNKVVSPNDTVYHLGDVFFTKDGAKHLRRLNGKKYLILGNHDDPDHEMIRDTFKEVRLWKSMKSVGLLLTHVPIYAGIFDETDRTDNRRPKHIKNVHGHLHEKVVDDVRYINVSVEQTDYTPINLEKVRAR